MSIKKIIHSLVCLFLLAVNSQAQTTYDFSTNATLSSGASGFGIWNTQANITIGGVDYILTSGANGSFTNSATGGVSNSKSLRKDGSGGDSFSLARVDGQAFQFYGIWVSHQSMNSYSTGPFAVSLPPWYTLSTTGAESFSYQDMTPMTAGTAYNNYTSSSIPISSGSGGKKVTSVTINFPAILYYTIDNIIVGPAAGGNPVITGNPPNRTICAGGTTTFSVTATDATSYQWYQNSGSGFIALTNTAPFSGVTTSTLTISGATAAMNGYQYRCVATNSAGSATSNSATLTVVNISTTGSKTDISCNGGGNGVATVVPSGGVAPYTYSWAPFGGTAATATGLSVGTYIVTVTDNVGCQTTRTFTINQPASAVNGTTVVTNIACNGGSNGSINLTPTGGTAPYTFNWGGGITTEDRTGLAAGTYTVIITDTNGCTATVNATITQPASAVSGTMVVTNVACNGASNGAINLTPTGGTAPYTFNWGGGITTEDRIGLAAGTYTVVITDANGCTATVNATVTQPASAVNGTTVVTNVACNGASNGAINLTPGGGTAPYTFNWGGGVTTEDRTGLAAGTYTVVITDANGCTATVNATVTQPTAMNATTSQTNIACNGGSTGIATINVAGGTAPYIYSWSPSGGTAATATGLSAGTYTVTVTSANGCTLTRTFTITQPTAIFTTGSQVNVACNGASNGSATVTASGGAGSYTYSWAPSGGTAATATGLSAGTYTVTVTDANNCVATRTFTITQPTAISTTGSQVNVACNGASNGSATVTASGGTGSYTYSWAPRGGTAATATGLAAGTYTVTVTDANNCVVTRTFTITQPASVVSGTTVVTNVACNGASNGAINLTPGGGTAPYTFNWGGGVTTEDRTGLVAGTYTVVITDANGCTATVNATVTQPANAVSGTTVVTNIACNGASTGAINLTPTGGTAPYTFNWGGGITTEDRTGLPAGSYSVTITDANGCTGTVNVTITQPPAMSATTSQTNVACNGGTNGSASVTVSGGTGAYTYLWSPSGGTAASATGLSAGTYTVTVTDANLCTITRTFTITQPTAMSATTSQTNVSCNGGANGSASVTVSGGTGAYTYSWSPSGGTAASATGLAAGTYTVTVTDANACTITRTFTITQPTAMSATTSQTNVSCNGGANGSASVTVSGGTGAYTYSWSPSGGTAATATGLAAGTYTVTVTDANACTITRTFTITQPTAMSATMNSTKVSCPGRSDGKASVEVSGGVAPFNYSWNNGSNSNEIINLTQGTYEVLITDSNGCTLVKQIFVDTTADITKPVPVVASLPAITRECAVIAADIPVPTAVDNCSGILTATTTDALAYTQQGTYIVNWTYNDGNGNTSVQQQTIIVDDITKPVPVVASLPTITRECAIIATDIPVPTAVDNCSGILTATTTDALAYTQQGTYTINWIYNDGNGNTFVQQQTIIVEKSPLADIVLNDLTTVYDGTIHKLMVDNLPAGAAVSYNITPQAEEDNGAVNAGVYMITAVVTPPAFAVNCEAVTLTAELVIEKATQTILFNELEVVQLEEAEDFQLSAVASSGLPVTYTYTYDQSTPAATVSAQGWVEIIHSGSVLISAHQQGNSNYLPAVSVDRSLVIKSKDASIQQIVINGQVYTNPSETIYYTMDCNDTSNEVSVQIDAEFGAAVSPARDFVIGVPKPGVYRQTIELISEDGTSAKTYHIIVERPFAFEDIVVQKFDNTLLINNNPQTNGGYRFVKYEWYRNDVLIGTEQVYSAGNSRQDVLDENALYRAILTTDNGDVIHTCASEITRTNNFKINIYPNPVRVNEQLQVVFDYPASAFNGATATLYTTSGKLVQSVKLSENVSSVKLPAGISEGIYMLILQIEGRQETIKVVVKQ